MKKIVSGILSVAMLCTSLCSFASPVQAAESVNVKISKGQRMTYISETSTQYKVRLYTELANGKYEATKTSAGATAANGIVGYINKADADVTYFNNQGRPWTDPYKAIYYGAKYIANNYLTHQYTLYFQKFNVITTGTKFSHEYMSHIRGAYSEGIILYNGYKNAGLLDAKHTFYIPVYNAEPGDTVVSEGKYKDIPKSYADKLTELEKNHPNWSFVLTPTGMSIADAVKGEMAVNKSASQDDIQYYINPLNFLTDEYIFQFESIIAVEANECLADSNEKQKLAKAILNGTWMADNSKPISYTDTEGEAKTVSQVKSYVEAIEKASTYSNLGVNYISSKIRQENGGTSPTATAVKGTVAPFQGMYNYFNIGAYVTASDGLAWAAGFMKAKTDAVLYNTNATVPQQTTTTTTTTTTTKNYTPAKVKLVSLTAYSSGHKIKAKWNKCSTSATGYQIYWAKDKSFKKIVAKTKITGRRYTTYTGKNFTKGRKYYVKIRAFKKANGKTYYGPWSNIKAKTAK